MLASSLRKLEWSEGSIELRTEQGSKQGVDLRVLLMPVIAPDG